MEISVRAPIFGVAFHPHEPLLAIASLDGLLTILRYENQTTTKYATRKERVGIRCIVFNNDDLLYGLRDGQLVVIKCKGMIEKYRTHETNSPISALIWLNDHVFIVGYDNGLLQAFDIIKPQPLWFTIHEFDDPISSLCRSLDGESFYATSGGYLALFGIPSKDHGTSLIAMCDENEWDMTACALFHLGQKVLVACDDYGVVIFNEGDLGSYRQRLGGIRYPLRATLALNENFFLAAGESGQILVGQVQPPLWLGVFVDLARGGDKEMSVDQLVMDYKNALLAVVDHTKEYMKIVSLENAWKIIRGCSDAVQKTDYAEFMDEL